MPKHEVGTAAYISNQIRKNQKTKIRWYCGLCHVPCKDENGYKCHLEHETHIHREQAVQESLRNFTLSKSDIAFRRKFLSHLVTKHFGQTVLAHDAYRDLYPLDRGHLIMKDTCWGTLGVFIAQLKKEGRAEALKGLKGWQVRVSAEDFVDSDDDVDQTGKRADDADEEAGSKRKQENDSIKLISLKRVKASDIEAHSAATTRISDNKVVFALGTSSSSSAVTVPAMMSKLKKNVPPAFAQSSSDEHDSD